MEWMTVLKRGKVYRDFESVLNEEVVEGGFTSLRKMIAKEFCCMVLKDTSPTITQRRENQVSVSTIKLNIHRKKLKLNETIPKTLSRVLKEK